MNWMARTTLVALSVAAVGLAASSTPAQGVPVFEIIKAESSIKFNVKASVPIAGDFQKTSATLVFTSPDLSTAVLDVKIESASVNIGSSMKDGKLKSKDFFDSDHDPLITFHSTKVTQTGPNTVQFDGDFTIRGVTKPEQLIFTVTGKGTGEGSITGEKVGLNKILPIRSRLSDWFGRVTCRTLGNRRFRKE
jgi:polyisoprenoid-binding protein YceI